MATGGMWDWYSKYRHGYAPIETSWKVPPAVGCGPVRGSRGNHMQGGAMEWPSPGSRRHFLQQRHGNQYHNLQHPSAGGVGGTVDCDDDIECMGDTWGCSNGHASPPLLQIKHYKRSSFSPPPSCPPLHHPNTTAHAPSRLNSWATSNSLCGPGPTSTGPTDQPESHNSHYSGPTSNGPHWNNVNNSGPAWDHDRATHISGDCMLG